MVKFLPDEPITGEKDRYCISRFQSVRFPTREVFVGSVGVGGKNPIRIQSMTTTPTQDVQATLRQSIALAEAGCEIVRITAQNVAAAQALKAIRKQFSEAGFNDIPLVADIHFLPKAAMEAIEHVEKVRVNPGNYADKKKFAVHEYSDTEYEEELNRLYEAFTPLVKRAKELGRTLRIGTNHGSLSDRIMNRYGDTPEGMVESALEFVRIAQAHGFYNIILSLKASNPKVMIAAYRLVVQKMAQEGMYYPLHLGVTEAGEGEDARVKSAAGIGTLLYDGIGDTIRVSLTEDPVYEIPVARGLAKRAMQLWVQEPIKDTAPLHDLINPFTYKRRITTLLTLGKSCKVGPMEPPRVIVPVCEPLSAYREIAREVCAVQARMKEAKIEGLLLKVDSLEDLLQFNLLHAILQPTVAFFVLELGEAISLEALCAHRWPEGAHCMLVGRADDSLLSLYRLCEAQNFLLALDVSPEAIHSQSQVLQALEPSRVVYTASRPSTCMHAVGTYRAIAHKLDELAITSPIWIRNTEALQVIRESFFTAHLIEASVLSGSLFCDGVGDLISIENEPQMDKALTLAYNILQGTRMRITKTEFVACPSCGRTLFDLQSTTLKIKEKTGHLKGVTIAIMGCIVNGPGEMADADFGYVGGSPGKVNLYVGKECVKYHIPEAEAVQALIDLIKEHGKWLDPISEESPSCVLSSV